VARPGCAASRIRATSAPAGVTSGMWLYAGEGEEELPCVRADSGRGKELVGTVLEELDDHPGAVQGVVPAHVDVDLEPFQGCFRRRRRGGIGHSARAR